MSVKTFRDFQEALSELRSAGGAMNYLQPGPDGSEAAWQVGECDDIQAATGTDPKACTRTALEHGGLSDIKQELAQWSDWPPQTMAKVTLNQIIEAVQADDNLGFCLACGARAFGVEPDAGRYGCEACGARRVYGAAEILMMVGV